MLLDFCQAIHIVFGCQIAALMLFWNIRQFAEETESAVLRLDFILKYPGLDLLLGHGGGVVAQRDLVE